MKITGQKDSEGNNISTNKDTSGRYHSDWLNMMYPRLKIARNLLKEDGVIFISIDDNELENLKKICNEIYGESNFVTQIVWRKKTGASDAKGIATISEYILVYVKKYEKINSIFTQNKESYDSNRYKLEDEYVKRRGTHYIDNLDRGGITYSDSMNYPIKCPDGTLTYPNGRTEFINDGWIWTWGKEKLEWGIKNGFIEFRKSKTKLSGWGVYYKNYMFVNNKDEIIERSAPHKNMISDVINTNASKDIKDIFGAKVFQYTKPKELIGRLISFIDLDEKDIILDFFSGSATTAHSVFNHNIDKFKSNKFILIQIPEKIDLKEIAYKEGYNNICEIGKERIRRAGNKIVFENKDKDGIEDLDIGFKVFKLDSSNIKRWNLNNKEDLAEQISYMEKSFVEGRTEEDILYELMLKAGIDITYLVEEVTINDKKIFNIGFGELLVCLDNDITTDIADEIVNLKNDRTKVIFKEAGFKNDSAKTNVLEILKRNKIKEVISV